MSFNRDMYAIRSIYSPGRAIQSYPEIYAFQRTCNRLVVELNRYRIRSNFNGYEISWKDDKNYRRFRNAVRNSRLKISELYEFSEHLERFSESQFSYSYEQNEKRFGELLRNVNYFPAKTYRIMRRYIDDFELQREYYDDGVQSDRRQSFMSLCIMDATFRLTFRHGGEFGDGEAFRSWKSKSFVILVSDIFGEH